MSPESKGDRIVKVATAANEAIARMLSELLTEEGIPSVVKAAGAGPAILPVATLPHYIYVLASDVPRAKELINFYLDSDASIGLVKERDDDQGGAGPGPVQ